MQRYFNEHYIKPGFSIQLWKEEREKLTAERRKVYREYNVLKSEVSEVEAIHRAAENIVCEINPPLQKDTRKRAWEW